MANAGFSGASRPLIAHMTEFSAVTERGELPVIVEVTRMKLPSRTTASATIHYPLAAGMIPPLLYATVGCYGEDITTPLEYDAAIQTLVKQNRDMETQAGIHERVRDAWVHC